MVKSASQKLRAKQKGLEAENPELLPKAEHPELPPKTDPKKKKKKKKKKTPVVISVDSEGNPIIDVQKSFEENPEPEQKPELLSKTTEHKKRKRKTSIPADVADTAVDAPKSIQVENLVQLPKPEPLVPADPTVPSKMRKRRKGTSTVPVDVAYPIVDVADPVVDAPESIEVEQLMQLPKPEPKPEPLPNPEPIDPTVPVRKWTKRKRNPPVPADVENPIFDAPKSVEVEDMVQLPKPEALLVPTVPSNKRSRKKRKTTAPVDGANPIFDEANPIVVDAPKSIEVENLAQLPMPEPELPTIPSKKKKKKGKTTVPVDVANPVVISPKSFEVEKLVQQLPKQPEPTLSRYVEICVICRKTGHSIPTCPELNDDNKLEPNDNSKPEPNDNSKPTPGKKKRKRNRYVKKPSQCPQPPQKVEMQAGQEDRLLVTGCAPQDDSMAEETNGGKEEESILKSGSSSHSQESLAESKKIQDPATGTCQDDSMADETHSGKEDESSLKAGSASHSQERQVEPKKIHDPRVVNSIA